MEISVQKGVIENILSNLQPFLEKKDASQITSHVLINAEDEKLELRATDYEIGLSAVTKEFTKKESGKVTVNGKKFLDIVRRLSDVEMIIRVDNDNLIIKQGKTNFKLPTFNADEFPIFPDYENNPKIDISSIKLIQSMKKIVPAIDNNNPKPELNGALIDIKEYALNFAATDTRRLSIVKFDNPSVNRLSLIIPKKAIIEIQKLFFDEIALYYNEQNMIIKSENYLFFTKLINGKYPDYERIVPKELRYNLILPKDKIIEAIKVVTSIANDIKITFMQTSIIFEGLSEENSESKTEFEFNANLNGFVVAVSSKYILDFLAQIDTTDFMMGLNEPNLPFLLKSENFLTIIMPIVL